MPDCRQGRQEDPLPRPKRPDLLYSSIILRNSQSLLTVYDAYFIALSRVEGKPLITADYKLAERVKGHKGIIKLLDM